MEAVYSPKTWYLPTRLSSVITQKDKIQIFTGVDGKLWASRPGLDKMMKGENSTLQTNNTESSVIHHIA
jgi:hypothetical protein